MTTNQVVSFDLTKTVPHVKTPNTHDKARLNAHSRVADSQLKAIDQIESEMEPLVQQAANLQQARDQQLEEIRTHDGLTAREKRLTTRDISRNYGRKIATLRLKMDNLQRTYTRQELNQLNKQRQVQGLGQVRRLMSKRTRGKMIKQYIAEEVKKIHQTRRESRAERTMEQALQNNRDWNAARQQRKNESKTYVQIICRY